MEKHDGKLPQRWSFLEVSHPNVVVSALKPGRNGGVILRVYEASGKPTERAAIQFHTDLLSAHEADLMEVSGQRIDAQNNTVMLDFHPFEIKTLKLEITAP